MTYRIKQGDTLWDISATYYRNPWLYPKLAKANSIKNPDLIFPVRVSSFLRIELFLALLAFPLFTAGCGPRQIWGVDAET